jgi:hypothetical protein
MMEEYQKKAIAVEKSLIAANTEAAKIVNINSGLKISELLPEAEKVFSGVAEQIKKVNEQADKMGQYYAGVFEQAAKSAEESSEKQQESVQQVGGEVENLGETWTNMYGTVFEVSKKTYQEILDDTEKVKRAIASIKYPSPPSSSAQGYADGGNHPGGFRIVGERGPELEYTGPARIFNNASTSAILRALQSLPNMSPATVVLPPAAAVPGKPGNNTYHQSVTVNLSGGAGQSSVKAITKSVMAEMQKMYRSRS